jgi:hypothetical protein
MKRAISLSLALTAAIACAQTWAITTAEHDDRVRASGDFAPTGKTMPSKSKQAMARMNAQLKAMQEIHNKMQAPQTGDWQ